mmetsp:Transcript_44335/g.70930  ORF Transcript_44335/g.70930 Transcript_44335/m.70930 type:complete len:1024 (-) Transcript_44335:657-3728(-)
MGGEEGVSIKVCIRCRPFVKDDELGVCLTQAAEETGEVDMLHSKYSTARFAFNWAMWSAYGWQRHLTGPGGKGEACPEDLQAAENMKLINQKLSYEACGPGIYKSLLSGNSIVLFAYGLSGSGKTFTVFGPDAADSPDAWFKHAQPHDMWGLFPNLAYKLFDEQAKAEVPWKISMKYFQNVVDTVRDLLSPMAKEMNYKSGMKKDKDGFMDIEWCESVVLESWDQLREVFQAANGRKAISPTQFNHQSTRGHCIMCIEVTIPTKQAGISSKGRLYVCDLAGTEPAGDIYYAKYEKKTFGDGTVEHKLLGPHEDQSKTKQLQDQGKKINLSLSEMASFFLKMAKAVKEKKLKPGQSIPGCNSYFLCKYLKPTMMQAQTYLFCAIRPEVEFHKYTFATLTFAKNASVIKLQPKKATTAQSKREMELMEELEKMRQMMEDMAKKSGGGGGGAVDMEEMNKMLAAKQQALVDEMKGDADKKKDEEMQKQKQTYAARGIALSFFEKEPAVPFLVNLDEDSFRNRRFIYLIEKEVTNFGQNAGDIRPLNMTMVDNHCSIEKKGAQDVYLVGGEGQVYHNGKVITKGEKVKLDNFDRVAIGADIMLFRFAYSPEDQERDEAVDVGVAIQEFHKALQSKDSVYQEQAKKLEEDKKKLMEQLEQMKRDGLSAEKISAKKQAMEAWKAIDETMIEMVPVLAKMNDMCGKVGRSMLNFKLSLQQPKVDLPFVKVQVTNTETDTVVFLDPFEIQSNMNILADQIRMLKTNDEYTVPEEEEIVKLLFDCSYQVGSCTNFLMHTPLLMETDQDDRELDVMKSVIPYNKIGTLDVFWRPMVSPDDESEPEEVVDADDLIGKSWTYKLEIGKLKNLPTPIAEAYIVYEFNGQRYVTDAVEAPNASREVDLEYSEILHVDVVDAEFLAYLDEVEFKFEVFIKPYVSCKLRPLSTSDAALCKNLGITVSIENDPVAQVEALKKENAELLKQLELLRQEKYEEAYKRHVAQLEDKIAQLESGPSKVKQKLADAKSVDSKLNK